MPEVYKGSNPVSQEFARNCLKKLGIKVPKRTKKEDVAVNGNLNTITAIKQETISMEEQGADKLTSGDMDYVLSILRHQVAKNQDRNVSENDLFVALSLVKKNNEHVRSMAK
jgi:hypothetical protein